ncbi:MAG: hypothetical protein QM622_10375 [Microbacterium sp.]
MTEPQSWALIGVFATIMLGGMTLMTTFITRTMNAAIGGLRGEMNARFEAVDARFAAVDVRFDAMAATMNARFEAVDARFDSVNAKIDHLDRDVAMVIDRVWPGSAAD